MWQWWLVVILSGGCVVGVVDDVTAQPPDPPDEAPLVGVLDSPRHGEVITEATDRAELHFHGYASRPGAVVSLQILADPTRADSWRELAKLAAADTPIEFAAGEQLYELEATLAPSIIAPGAWPQGGLVRVRARFEDDTQLTMFADDANACLAARASWADRSAGCGYHLRNGAIIVSPGSLAPLIGALAPRGLFLDRKGDASVTETQAYYAATAAPATLADFRARYGFGSPTEASAAYYNRGDLAVGRDMHCVQFPAGADQGLACYSSNYGAFSGPRDEALAKTIAGFQSGASAGAFATVTMVYQPPIDAPNAVSFAVYNGTGARVDTAQLDRFGDNTGIPQNCLNCHGSASRYDPTIHATTNVRFLPFDPAALDFATQPGFTFADQAPRLAALNAMVREAAPAAGVDELLAGFYRTAQVDVEFIPGAWKATVEDTTIYRNVVAPYCRGCHATYDGGANPSLAFRTPADLRGNAAMIAFEACGPRRINDTHGMPSAEVVGERFLAGPARAYLADLSDATGACVYGQ